MSKKAFVIDYGLLILGITLLAMSINIFYEPNQLVVGGVSGLAIVIGETSQSIIGYKVPIWLTNLVLNIPLFLLGFKTYGWKVLARTLFSTLFLSLAIKFTSFLPDYNGDLIICAVFGGLFEGIGLGLVFKCFTTTGGTDLAASIIHKRMPHFSVAKILMVIDWAIILTGMFVFGVEKAMYALIAIFLTSKVIDTVLTGFNFSKAAFIISNKNEEIAAKIIETLDRSATELFARGMYSLTTKNVLLCVVNQREIATIKEIIKEIEPTAFVIVADVREVLGEGFVSIHKKSLK